MPIIFSIKIYIIEGEVNLYRISQLNELLPFSSLPSLLKVSKLSRDINMYCFLLFYFVLLLLFFGVSCVLVDVLRKSLDENFGFGANIILFLYFWHHFHYFLFFVKLDFKVTILCLFYQMQYIIDANILTVNPPTNY